MITDPCEQAPKSVRCLGLSGETGAELRLSAHAAEIEHQFPRRGEGDLRAAILFNECQGKVDAGSDPCRGIDVAVAKEDGVGTTSVRENNASSCAVADQCVVQRRPSSRPDPASRNAPVHTLAIRLVRGARSRSHLIKSVFAATWRSAGSPPPETITVSRLSSNSPSGVVPPICMPELETIVPPSGLATTVS